MKLLSFLILATGLQLVSPGMADSALPWRVSGNPTQGAVLFGQTTPGARIELDGRTVPVSESGRFVLGFGRDAAPEAQLSAVLSDGTRVSQTLKISPRDYQVQRIDGLPPAQVTPPPEVLARIADDNAQVRKARSMRELRDDFANGFIWPAAGPISGVYGSQRILNGEPRRPHYGVDVAAPVGTPVVAPAPGMVTLAHNNMYYSGGTLIIDHGHGLSSTFLHLSALHVAPGQRVEQGDLIGEIGATGRVTGPHLDWRMNWGSERVDPQLLVPCRAAGGAPCAPQSQ